MKRVIIFASGAGSNAENIIRYFQNSKKISVEKVFCNKKEAGVFNRFKKLDIDCEWFSREDFSHSNTILEILTNQTDFIVLAGFLWKIPENIVTAFPNKIINIHPALLPKYGGKGMYGMNIHNAVIDKKEKKSGITIHYVNQNYDEGELILQERCAISSDESVETLTQKIRELEYSYFPNAIEKTIKELSN